MCEFRCQRHPTLIDLTCIWTNVRSRSIFSLVDPHWFKIQLGSCLLIVMDGIRIKLIFIVTPIIRAVKVIILGRILVLRSLPYCYQCVVSLEHLVLTSYTVSGMHAFKFMAVSILSVSLDRFMWLSILVWTISMLCHHFVKWLLGVITWPTRLLLWISRGSPKAWLDVRDREVCISLQWLLRHLFRVSNPENCNEWYYPSYIAKEENYY